KDRYESELVDILQYVEQVQEAVGNVDDLTPSFDETDVKNVMREDTDPHDTGAHTKDLLGEAPRTKDGYVQVKKILNND
ncbi:MAG: Asp-tRNA(Asn)/Glu-tRNA(Gln) amidotransferase subunit GatC, partial [Candidatus Paceibacterota bacterium]